MQLFVNDLSLHGQFQDIETFKDAIDRMMKMRQLAKQYGFEIYCHRNIVNVKVTPALFIQQVIQYFDKNRQRAIMQWLTRTGPFWEDSRSHSPDEYLECRGDVVTDTVVGEAAFNCFNGVPSNLVSFSPSDWEFSPISVAWMIEEDKDQSVEIANHWIIEKFQEDLQAAPIVINSWQQLEEVSNERYPRLNFSKNCFEPLKGHPFVPNARHQLLRIFKILNHFKSCFNQTGQRTPEGHEIFQNFFTGSKGAGGRGALFSDSSNDEKQKFKKELTFKHPLEADKNLFCPWHGKVQTPPLRVHFSYPIRADKALFIVYVGPKIIKR
jgi:hypothetical protein